MQIWGKSLHPVSPVDHNFTPNAGPHVPHTFSPITVSFSGFWFEGKEPSVPPLRFKIKKDEGSGETQTLHVRVNISCTKAPVWVLFLCGSFFFVELSASCDNCKLSYFIPVFVSSSIKCTLNSKSGSVSKSKNDACHNKAGRAILMTLFRFQFGPLRESKCSCTTAL